MPQRKRAAKTHEGERAATAEAEAALRRLHAIESITDGALRHLGLDELLRELLARLRRALDADTATMMLLDEDGQTLSARAVDGYTQPPGTCIRVPLGKGVTGVIAAEGRPLIVNDYSTIDVSFISGMTPSQVFDRVKAIMGVPLRIGDKVVGVVVVNSSRPRRFTEEELGLLGLVADRVAPAIEVRRFAERLLTAQEEERRRLAVELHDELGQVLTAVKINLASLERSSVTVPVPPDLRDAIGSIDRAMATVRDLALALRPSVLDDLGLPAALRWYADRLGRDGRIETRLSMDAIPRLTPEIETTCFRVAQEALTNVVRHARADHLAGASPQWRDRARTHRPRRRNRVRRVGGPGAGDRRGFAGPARDAGTRHVGRRHTRAEKPARRRYRSAGPLACWRRAASSSA